MILAVIPIFYLVLFALGVGLILAAITVKFRDVIHLYSVLMAVFLYLTPVIYPLSILPDWLCRLVMLNPLTNVLNMFRDVVLYDRIFSVSTFAVTGIEAVLCLALGFYIFYKRQDSFILDL